MNLKKQKRKAARRADKSAERAWDAVASGNLDLARKEIRRALQERQDNPMLWDDLGAILTLSEEWDEAETAFRNAILISPEFSPAYAHLASLLGRLGRTRQALRMQERAVELCPDDAVLRKQLGAIRVLVPDSQPQVTAPLTVARSEVDQWLVRYDWARIQNALTDHGCTVLRGFLDEEFCTSLRDQFDHREQFEKTVSLGGRAGSGGTYRFYHRPLPPLVEALRTSLYQRVVPIVNEWQRLFDEDEFPPEHEDYLARFARDGQTRSTPLLLRYTAPAVNQPHQDVSGEFTFPLQCAIVLSEPAVDLDPDPGGEFVLVDQAAEGRRTRIKAGMGDAILFASQSRPVPAGADWEPREVAHGMDPLRAGVRFVLGLPFHDYGPRQR